ncbi:MAG: hypothetical protein K2Y37_11630 [Pirellulales bacterium]|nr:hypothetical protein [Pirellulales bacterium]
MTCAIGESWAATFQGLGIIPPTGSDIFESQAIDLSANGSVVVGLSAGKVFLWTHAAGIVPIGAPPGTASSRATALSPTGETVAGYLNSFDQVPLTWTGGGGYLPLGNPAGYANGAANDVSTAGATVVGWSDNHSFGSEQAWRWTSANGFELLGFLPGAVGSTANAVSANGNIIAGRGHVVGDSGLQALLWIGDNAPVGLGYLPLGTTSFAEAISSDGTAVVGAGLNVFSLQQAFLWTTGSAKLTPLGSASMQSHALAVSNSGNVVVGRAQPLPLGSAFIWDATNGMRSLQSVLINQYGLGPSLLGWTLTEATAISDNGKVIVGNGIDPQGHMQGWIFEVPEPAGLLAALPGAAVIVCLVRRRRHLSVGRNGNSAGECC